jgi:glycosyltransferase involved in cell wall biosynthesis
LDAILNQTFENFELVIADNQSTDDTAEICREYARRDKRIALHVNDANIGAALNFNKAFELSSAAYFKWASSNDIIAPDYLARCVEILDSKADVVIAASKTQIINENDEVIEQCHEDMHLYDDDPFVRFTTFLDRVRLNNLEQALMRSDVLRKTTLQAVYPSSDTLLVAEMVARGKVHQLPDFLLSRRIARSSTTNLMTEEEIANFYLPNATHIPYLRLRITAALFGIATRLDVPFSTRMRFYRHWARSVVMSRDEIGQDLATYIRRLGRSASSG